MSSQRQLTRGHCSHQSPAGPDCRAALLDTKLPPVREDAAWRLLLWMREGYDASQILADPAAARLVDATRDLSASAIKDASLVPVKTVATPLAHFELYVECEGP